MRRLYLLALVCLWAVSLYGQVPGSPATPNQNATGNITATGTTCATTNACISIHLASNVSVIAVTTSGTFTATGTAESSADNGVTWTSQGTITTATVTNFTSSAWTDFRIRCSAFTSGTMGVFINTGTGGTVTVSSGTAALGTSAISSNTCATVVTATATGVLTTDNLMADFNSDPTAITGYIPGAMLTIVKYPTSGSVNFKICNNTGSSITPSPVTLNWRVVR